MSAEVTSEPFSLDLFDHGESLSTRFHACNNYLRYYLILVLDTFEALPHYSFVSSYSLRAQENEHGLFDRVERQQGFLHDFA